MEKGEIETPETEIAEADTENEDRIEVPNEHGHRKTVSSKSGRKEMKNMRLILKY